MRKLLTVPDPRLREKSAPVKAIDSLVKEVAEYLLAQLEPLKAIGFAASQFGEMIRVIVIKRDELTTVAIVNPEIVKEKGEQSSMEGCRSIPGKFYLVKRPKIVKVKGINLNGEGITIKGHDLLATVLRHEVDHLDGVLIDSIGKPI